MLYAHIDRANKRNSRPASSKPLISQQRKKGATVYAAQPLISKYHLYFNCRQIVCPAEIPIESLARIFSGRKVSIAKRERQKLTTATTKRRRRRRKLLVALLRKSAYTRARQTGEEKRGRDGKCLYAWPSKVRGRKRERER